MIEISSKGSFDNTEKFLKKLSNANEVYATLERYGKLGVQALARATPVDEGETARSWTYEIVKDSKSWSIIWDNTHIRNGRPIAILLQYGHATRTGGLVRGRDYINPALKPIFDQIEAEAWKAVTKA